MNLGRRLRLDTTRPELPSQTTPECEADPSDKWRDIAMSWRKAETYCETVAGASFLG
jgi:hypothetical protein